MFTRILTGWLLALFLVGGIGFNSGLVVCYGDDGHVAVEVSDGADCNDHVEGVSHGNPELQANHCGPCTDVPFITALEETAVPAAHISPIASPVAVALPPVVLVFKLRTVSIASFPQPPPFSDPTLDIRQSIVLQV